MIPNVSSQKHIPVATSLNQVKNLIAVSSCKGGVGKSTIAAHLAMELSRRNYKVGLVDADIYGPSLPVLFNLDKIDIYTNAQNQLIPHEWNNLKLMSFGFLLGDGPAVMRGPIVTRYIQQILLNTDWGDLDYLIIDMPPGTGDVQLTITQSSRLTGAVIVTTPHTLSITDVARGILMFEKVNVPIIGVIENMSYVELENSKKHYIFGQPAAQKLQDRFGINLLAELPILPSLSTPLDPNIKNNYVADLVNSFESNLKKIKDTAFKIPKINFDAEKIELAWENGEKWTVKNFDLRINSQDALSVDEMTGKSRIDPKKIRPDIAAKEITPLGNYGIGVAWNDGHSSAIYTYQNIKKLSQIVSNS